MKTPSAAKIAQIAQDLRVPKKWAAQFFMGYEVEWEHAHTVHYDPYMVGQIVLDHLDEDPKYYTKLARIHRENPAYAEALYEVVRLNGANQKYLRRVPMEGKSRRYRYIYDPKRLAPTGAQPKLGEKVKVPHGDQPGHYEVVQIYPSGRVRIVHDETGHEMQIKPEKLYDLLRAAHISDYKQVAQLEQEEAFRKSDRLPRSKKAAYEAIKDASDIDDHDSAKADVAYWKWKQSGKRGKKPRDTSIKGIDAFERDDKKFSSLLEAFEDATKGAKTWKDIEPVLEMLRGVAGFEKAEFPASVYDNWSNWKQREESVGEIDVERFGQPIRRKKKKAAKKTEKKKEKREESFVDEDGFDWATGDWVAGASPGEFSDFDEDEFFE
jgi:hypothetical protein